MNNLDEQIRSALGPDHAGMLGAPEEGERVDELVISAFKSRNRAWTIFGVIFSLVFVALFIYCAVAFFDAQQTKHQIAWGIGASLCMLAVVAIKIWFWLEMQRLAISREIKRVELLTARLIRRLDDRDQHAT